MTGRPAKTTTPTTTHIFSRAVVGKANNDDLAKFEGPADAPDLQGAPRGIRCLRRLVAPLGHGEVNGRHLERHGRPAGKTRSRRGGGGRGGGLRARFDQHAGNIAPGVGRAIHKVIVSPAHQKRRAVGGPDGYIPKNVVAGRPVLEKGVGGVTTQGGGRAAKED